MSRKSISDDVGYGDVAPESCADRLMQVSESRGIVRERGVGVRKEGKQKGRHQQCFTGEENSPPSSISMVICMYVCVSVKGDRQTEREKSETETVMGNIQDIYKECMREVWQLPQGGGGKLCFHTLTGVYCSDCSRFTLYYTPHKQMQMLQNTSLTPDVLFNYIKFYRYMKMILSEMKKRISPSFPIGFLTLSLCHMAA